ncbi:hypothetical protein ACOALZ_15465 [Nocardiopsis algeriensis]|uniref:hypothetical protein n=1 Tax=Nocardiopsis algeriensis TaxID=1478215 RepID=UPI003B429C57
MPNPLDERVQRFVFIGLIAVLVAFGVYLSVGGLGGGSEDEEQERQETAQDTETPPQDSGPVAVPDGLSTVEPSPLPTTGAGEADVLEWFPFGEEELQTAGATAQGFAEAYGTIDYTEPPETYYSSLRALATAEYSEVLESSRAGAFWGEMSEAEAVAEGRAEIEQIRSFGDDSITFVVTAQSITETSNEEFDEDLGEFAITVVRSGSSWKVYDFQPADAGQLGEERTG